MAWREPITTQWIVVAVVCLGGLGAGYALRGKTATPPPIRITGGVEQPTGPEPKPSVTESEVVVQVTGAVWKPGVLHLPAGSRVDDALKAAGGAKDGADLTPFNLAAKLVDGTQLRIERTRANEVASSSRPSPRPRAMSGQIPPMPIAIPEEYRATPPVASPYRPDASPAAGIPDAPRSRGGAKHPTGQVSLNTGSAEQFQTLPGIGPATAAKIIQYRQDHGGFSSVDELLAVKGIGPKKMEALRQWLKL